MEWHVTLPLQLASSGKCTRYNLGLRLIQHPHTPKTISVWLGFAGNPHTTKVRICREKLGNNVKVIWERWGHARGNVVGCGETCLGIREEMLWTSGADARDSFRHVLGMRGKRGRFLAEKGVDVKEFARGNAGEAVERLGTYSENAG